MGNALEFQAKFTRIQEYTEQQNFQSVWLEYGDLFYLIWNFEPLTEGSYDSILDYVNDFAEKAASLDENNPVHRVVQAANIPTVAQQIHTFAQDFNSVMNNLSDNVKSFFDDLKYQQE